MKRPTKRVQADFTKHSIREARLLRPGFPIDLGAFWAGSSHGGKRC